MKEYSIPRRIWRIINPLLIYLAITIAVGLIFGISLSVLLVVQSTFGGSGIDVLELANEMQRIIIEYAMPIMITGNLAALAAFIPMWISSRKRLDAYQNISPAANYGLTIGLFAAFNMLLVCAFTLLDAYFNIMDYFPSYEGVSDALSKGSLATQLLSLGIMAPVVEEFCFRGIMMERMRWLPVWATVAIQAIFFGVAHLNLFQGAYAFVLGIILGLVYIKFRSIVVVIVGHAAFNITSVVHAYIDAEPNVLFILIPSLALLVFCAIFMIKRSPAYMVAGKIGGMVVENGEWKVEGER